MNYYKFPLINGLLHLPTPDGKRFTTLFRHRTMSLEVYAPRGTNPQQPHPQDELYFVVSGRGDLIVNEQRLSFAPGDTLFVPAAAVHRFEGFTDDLALWVVFWGPPRGERP
jgi:mannose-6-phosphate isomerase-like protein (cupin superfamily)